ncbi:hypothetical protein N9363_05065 [Paracoccaceae bacterium]|nr:hypothetical protein [Paracoccaceae bacterium]
MNANANDIKLRDNRASRFRHFAILSGSNNIISGNHFYQGDKRSNCIQLAGIALTQTNTTSTIMGNYVDNCFIEWTNEHDGNPDYRTGSGFWRSLLAIIFSYAAMSRHPFPFWFLNPMASATACRT